MSEKKNTWNGFMPFMPPAGWNKDNCKEQWKEFKSTVEKFWEQLESMQETAMANTKAQWDEFFPQLLEMEETFAASLPEVKVSLPGLPPLPAPKEVAAKVKEFQETANAHAIEQKESFDAFVKKGQAQAKEAVTEAVKNIEDNLEQK